MSETPEQRPPAGIDEPPVDPLHDTQPRAISLEARLAAEEPPVESLDDTAEYRPRAAIGRVLMLAAVMSGAVCLCLVLVGLAGFAGYRDGLATNDARITQTLATGIAEQYDAGVTDLAQGYPELAEARFAWIVETIQAPTQYARDSRVQLALARTVAAFTPTPTITPTLTPSPSPSPTSMPTAETLPAATETPSGSDPAYLYRQAELSMAVFKYEDAIEWLDALQALAPDHRAAEVNAMLMDALTKQGKIYLYGWNEDGEDRLMRGVLLIRRAEEIGTVEPRDLVGQADFVEMYINARNYVNGGQYAAAIPVLEQLCNWNCGWGYQGVTVRDLLDKAQAGS